MTPPSTNCLSRDKTDQERDVAVMDAFAMS